MRSYGCELVERGVTSTPDAPTATGKLNKTSDYNVAKKSPSVPSLQARAGHSSVGVTQGYRWIALGASAHSFPGNCGSLRGTDTAFDSGSSCDYNGVDELSLTKRSAHYVRP